MSRQVAVAGVGLHPFGRFPELTVSDLCRRAAHLALRDASMQWSEIQAVSSASSRFSGGKGWGLNGNDLVETEGPNGLPVYNLSAGCAAGGSAFNVAHALIAGGIHDVVMVVGGETLPKGFISYAALDDPTDAEYLRQRCVGLPGPALWGIQASHRMATVGTTEEQLAAVAVKARRVAAENPNARFRQPLSVAQVLKSPMVSDPLHLFEICPVSDGAAAVILCAKDRLADSTHPIVRVASTCVATGQFDDGVPRSLSSVIPAGLTHHSEVTLAVTKALEEASVEVRDLDVVEISDNAVTHELELPESWGMCAPGEADSLVEKGETLPSGTMPINPSGGFLCFGEATTAMGLFQICELTWQLRGQSGTRQVARASVGMAQTIGLGGNASAIVLQK